MRESFPGEQAHAGVVRALCEVVADFQLILPSAQLAGGARGEVIGKREKNLGAEGLQKSAPALARQRRAKRTDALRGDDGDTLRLARETKEFLVARWIVIAYGGEVLVLIAQEEYLAEIAIWVRLDLRYTIEDCSLEVELHHDAKGLRKSGVHPDGEIESADLPLLNQPGE